MKKRVRCYEVNSSEKKASERILSTGKSLFFFEGVCEVGSFVVSLLEK